VVSVSEAPKLNVSGAGLAVGAGLLATRARVDAGEPARGPASQTRTARRNPASAPLHT
jgi:hypothetical protein